MQATAFVDSRTEPPRSQNIFDMLWFYDDERAILYIISHLRLAKIIPLGTESKA